MESELFWSEEYSKADLMELVTALHALKVLRTKDGKAASMTMIAAALCSCFHASLTRVNRKKWDVVNRKISVTRFLDALREAIITISQK